MEVWKNLKDYEGYIISNYGSVKSLDRYVVSGNKKLYRRGVELKQRIGKEGYKYIVISKDKNRKTLKIHRLVAINFIDNNKNKPCVNHIVDNLEWVTYSENTQHAQLIGLKKSNKGEKSHLSKLNLKQIKNIKEEYSLGNISQLKLGAKYGVSQSQIWRIVRNINWM